MVCWRRVLIAVCFCTLSASQARAECGRPEPTCSLLRDAPIIFIGTLTSDTDGEYRFRVEERIKGVKGSTISVVDIVFEGSSGYAGTGKRYLVFADTFDVDGVTRAVFRSCSRNMQLLEFSQPLARQLRREREGRRMSALYGSVFTDPYDATTPVRHFPGIRLTFQSDRATFTVTTDAQGSYAIDRMPPGSYHVRADLPPEFELGQIILHGPPPPVEIERDACLEQEIVAIPGGRISGTVFGPDRTPRKIASVRLFKADDYRRDARGPYALQLDGRPFTFDRLLPGDYLVVFHAEEDATVDSPFSTTFHANASEVKNATVIHLGAGQQISNANIQLPAASPTRTLRITLDWNGHNRSLYDKPFLFRPANALTDVKYLADDSLELELVTSATYRITAHASCRSAMMNLLTSDAVAVDGADRSTSHVTLTFNTGGCPSDARK